MHPAHELHEYRTNPLLNTRKIRTRYNMHLRRRIAIRCRTLPATRVGPDYRCEIGRLMIGSCAWWWWSRPYCCWCQLIWTTGGGPRARRFCPPCRSGCASTASVAARRDPDECASLVHAVFGRGGHVRVPRSTGVRVARSSRVRVTPLLEHLRRVQSVPLP
ncbi:hypothetical protein C8J57DRAFT_1332642 [Mycena rebaudengoi]|nr:hypothetical protein C8J57DRAFT_1332642 [Mycena rebaudengoi]